MSTEPIRANLYVSPRTDAMLFKRIDAVPKDARAERMKQWALIGSLIEESNAALLIAHEGAKAIPASNRLEAATKRSSSSPQRSSVIEPPAPAPASLIHPGLKNLDEIPDFGHS